MDKQQLVPWINGDFANGDLSLFRHAFNMLHAPNHDAGVAACGHFLRNGLEQGERVALVTFDHPDHILGCMRAYGFDFSEALEKEQLIYVYYKSTSVRSVRLAADYGGLFDELLQLCNGAVERVAFLNIELLINLQSLPLAQTSVAELTLAATASGTTVLGSRTPLPGAAGDYLEAACGAFVPANLELKKVSPHCKNYRLNWLKSPGRMAAGEVQMVLREGQGYVDATSAIAATA